MHILITDSGVGGLSVCAYVERFLRVNKFDESVRLTYVNAAPENDFGYNSMGSREEKLVYFDCFLQIVSEAYTPDMIYVACNTLLVLLPDTTFLKMGCVPVKGIVKTGGEYLLRALEGSPRSTAIIFGTVTTIQEGAYSSFLQNNSIHMDRIISQACQSLVDTISEDRPGLKALEEIDGYVTTAIGKSRGKPASYFAYLACTHYGYREDSFTRAFERHGIDAVVINPNMLAVDDLFEDYTRFLNEEKIENKVEVEFVTR